MDQITANQQGILAVIRSHEKYKNKFQPTDQKTPLILGIAGGSCAGKGYVSKLILSGLQGRVLKQDDYYIGLNGHQQPDQINWDHPEAMDSKLLESNLLDLREGRIINKPIYDMPAHSRTGYEFIVPSPLIIFEGIFALLQNMRPCLDLTIFVDAPDNIRLSRRIDRDQKERGRSREDILRQWKETVIPMHYQFVEPQREIADILVENHNDHIAL